MWWWANISARTTTSLKASSISCSAICGSVCSSCRSLSSAEVGHTSRSRRGSASIPAAARLKRSYSCSRRTSSARGSSSPSSSSLGRGSSMRDLISASVAAITRYSPASSSCRPCMSSMYCMYWRVISASGISRMFRFCRRMRYSSRSSGPSKASRNTSRACGGMYRSRGSCEIGSPFTIANGISACCGGVWAGSGASAAGGGALETTIFSCGLCFMRVPAPAPSVGAQMHGAPHFVECLARDLARLVGALGDDAAHQLRVVLELLGAPAHAADLLHDPVDQRLLAVQATDAGAAATLVHPLARGLVGVELVQVPHRALLRVARVGAPHQRLGALQRFPFAALLELAAQLPVGGGIASPQALHRALRLHLEVRLAPVEVVEAPRGFAAELHVRHLVLAHRHVGGAVHQDVGALQQRVAEEAVGPEILLLQLLLLILVTGYALEPPERCDHRQEQVQLRVLGHVRLDEQRRDPGIEAGRQPVDEHLVHVLLQLRGLVVAGREHVPVGHEEEALVLVLQLHPVAQRAVIVAEVQPPGGSHARQDAPRRRRRTHVRRRSGPAGAGADAGARPTTIRLWLTS